MNTEPQIEPVTDEDTRVAMQSYFINMKHILIHDRRRVAERQAVRDATLPRDTSQEQIALLRAELARLTAACAAKDAALIRCVDWFGSPSECFDPQDSIAHALQSALSPDAGKGWIDATGAVETGVFWYSGRYVVEIPKSMALSRVLIVRKP